MGPSKVPFLFFSITFQALPPPPSSPGGQSSSFSVERESMPPTGTISTPFLPPTTVPKYGGN